MFIDTHCHLSCEDYDDIDLIIEENKKAGIEKIKIAYTDNVILKIFLFLKFL